MTTLPLAMVNGELHGRISPFDRGFNYADGLFETLRVERGKLPLWERHRRRLHGACERLAIPLSMPLLEAEIQALLAAVSGIVSDIESAVLKIVVTRGEGGRGYRPPQQVNPTRCLSLHAWPHWPETHYREGLCLDAKPYVLNENPALAGLKHLSRLDHVLASAATSAEQGLICDGDGHILETTSGNLFLIKGQRLLTPSLVRGGVCGVLRGLIMEELAPALGIAVEVGSFDLAFLQEADEVFCGNSVAGIWPVNALDGICRFGLPGPLTQQLMAAWAQHLELKRKS